MYPMWWYIVTLENRKKMEGTDWSVPRLMEGSNWSVLSSSTYPGLNFFKEQYYYLLEIGRNSEDKS